MLRAVPGGGERKTPGRRGARGVAVAGLPYRGVCPRFSPDLTSDCREAVTVRRRWGEEGIDGERGEPMTEAGLPVEVEGLTKRFGRVTAVDELSFRVEAGG